MHQQHTLDVVLGVFVARPPSSSASAPAGRTRCISNNMQLLSAQYTRR
jgi:hypothetical protein